MWARHRLQISSDWAIGQESLSPSNLWPYSSCPHHFGLWAKEMAIEAPRMLDLVVGMGICAPRRVGDSLLSSGFFYLWLRSYLYKWVSTSCALTPSGKYKLCISPVLMKPNSKPWFSPHLNTFMYAFAWPVTQKIKQKEYGVLQHNEKTTQVPCCDMPIQTQSVFIEHLLCA